MTGLELVARARTLLGRKTVYALGRGGYYPQSDTAADVLNRCDCTGYLAWIMGVSRKFRHPWYPQSGEWLETSAIVKDTQNTKGLFDAVPPHQARPGMVYVYGDSPSGQGHVGLITETDALGPVRVIHCSAGNYRAAGDAIQESDCRVFTSRHAIVAEIGGITYTAAEVT